MHKHNELNVKKNTSVYNMHRSEQICIVVWHAQKNKGSYPAAVHVVPTIYKLIISHSRCFWVAINTQTAERLPRERKAVNVFLAADAVLMSFKNWATITSSIDSVNTSASFISIIIFRVQRIAMHLDDLVVTLALLRDVLKTEYQLRFFLW